MVTRLTPTRKVSDAATPKKYSFSRPWWDRPASIDPSVRYTTAEFSEWPLGKLEVITWDLWGTTAGRARWKLSLSTVLRRRPPRVAQSSNARARYF